MGTGEEELKRKRAMGGGRDPTGHCTSVASFKKE